MIKKLITSVFGTRFEREVRRMQPVLQRIWRHEEQLKDLSEAELKAQTDKFRGIIAERTGALQAEREEVRAAKHNCADPTERDALESRFQKLDAEYRKAVAYMEIGRASCRERV